MKDFPLMEKALFKETGIEEKRIFPRFKVHYLADVYMGDEILFATVIDISQNGIGIVLPKKFFIKEILNIRINCNLINKEKSELQKVNIYLRAQIIWIKKEDSLYLSLIHI